MLIFPLLTLQAAYNAKCFRPPRARGTAPASTMILAPRWAPQQRQSWSRESPSARITSVMAATTAKAAASTLSSSAVSTVAPFLPTGSGDGVNLTYRTTLTTVTVTTNETSINATAFPEPVMESSGMGMVLIPFGIITVLGLAVAIVRKYLQINITNLGLSTVVFQIRKGKVKHDCVIKSAWFAVIRQPNHTKTVSKTVCKLCVFSPPRCCIYENGNGESWKTLFPEAGAIRSLLSAPYLWLTQAGEAEAPAHAHVQLWPCWGTRWPAGTGTTGPRTRRKPRRPQQQGKSHPKSCFSVSLRPKPPFYSFIKMIWAFEFRLLHSFIFFTYLLCTSLLCHCYFLSVITHFYFLPSLKFWQWNDGKLQTW